jgi:hypothetical protein
MPEQQKSKQLRAFRQEYGIEKFEEFVDQRQNWFIIELKYWIQKFETAESNGLQSIVGRNALIDFTAREAFHEPIQVDTLKELLPFLKERLALAQQRQLPKVRHETILSLSDTTAGEWKLKMAEDVPGVAQLSTDQFLDVVNETVQRTAKIVSELDPTAYAMDRATIGASWGQQLDENTGKYQRLILMSKETLNGIERGVQLSHKDRVKLQRRSVRIQLRMGEFEKWFTENHLPIPANAADESAVKARLLDQCRVECERRELPKGETINLETKYDIAESIGLDGLGSIETFKSGDPAYHRISKMLSELGYKRKRAAEN